MATLGSIFHDFPRLAKQSGFYFQLHKGRVNWTELENLNIDEIIQNRNFQLLEHSLINVINCDLEREYDLKILDQNFVKLFKLAQLGLDYLSYCEMYLDRCVVLLQEELTASRQDYECLKLECERKQEEFSKSSRKSKTQSYQCEKCEKVFISDVYLKFHDKRRHSSPSTHQSSDGLRKKSVIDNCQQTENGRTLSTSTQTLFFDEAGAVTQENRDAVNIKMHHVIKMEKLEQELQEVKERLKKAETSLREKNEACNSHSPFQVPSSMNCNPVIMLLPSYLKQSENGLYEINPGCHMSLPVQEIHQPTNPPLPPAVTSGTAENCSAETEPEKENISQKENSESEKICKNESEFPSHAQTSNVIENFRNYHGEEKEEDEHDKENVDPNIKKNVFNSVIPPLPPPRKSKRDIRAPTVAEEKQTEEVCVVGKEENHSEDVGSNDHSVINTFTAFREKQDEEILPEIFEGSRAKPSEINKSESVLSEDLRNRERNLHEQRSKSLIKKIIKGNSPNLQKFSKSLKKSLTNLYDSVSSSEKDLKSRESSDKNLKTTVVDGLHNRLRQLGVDPEWSGIPKKTMKQKLNTLKYKRRLLSKENPKYPAIRQNIEEKIFQKLKKNLNFKKTSLIHKLNAQDLINTEGHEVLNIQDELLDDKTEFVRVKNCPMYDIDTDSESKASDSEKDFTQRREQSTSQKTVIVEEFSSDTEEKVGNKMDQEFDLSVFQAGGRNLMTKENPQKYIRVDREDELISYSDNEGNLLENSDQKTFKTLNTFLSHKKRGESKNLTGSHNQAECSGKANSENQSILKEDRFHSGLSTNGKRKVLFAMSNVFEEELSDSPLDDDLWSFKSDLEKDTG